MIEPGVQLYREEFRQIQFQSVPASECEIAEFECALGIKLPAAYVAFLSIAGNGFSGFEGSHYSLQDDLATLQQSAPRMSPGAVRLPSEAFVFKAHQGFAFHYFLPGADNPPVYEFVRGVKANDRVADSFVSIVISTAS